MKVVKVEDVKNYFERSGNMLTAYDFDRLPSFELPIHDYKVEVSYTLTVSGYSEDDAIENAEKLIGQHRVPYDTSCVTKIN